MIIINENSMYIITIIVMQIMTLPEHCSNRFREAVKKKYNGTRF